MPNRDSDYDNTKYVSIYYKCHEYSDDHQDEVTDESILCFICATQYAMKSDPCTTKIFIQADVSDSFKDEHVCEECCQTIEDCVEIH